MCKKSHPPITKELFYKVKKYYEAGHSTKEVASRFMIGETTARKIHRSECFMSYKIDDRSRRIKNYSIEDLERLVANAKYDRKSCESKHCSARHPELVHASHNIAAVILAAIAVVLIYLLTILAI